MAKEIKFGTGITQRMDKVIDAETATDEDMREWKKAVDAVNQYRHSGGNMANIRERASAILIQDKEPLTEQSRKWYARARASWMMLKHQVPYDARRMFPG